MVELAFWPSSVAVLPLPLPLPLPEPLPAGAGVAVPPAGPEGAAVTGGVAQSAPVTVRPVPVSTVTVPGVTVGSTCSMTGPLRWENTASA